jgi:hypothetical protein
MEDDEKLMVRLPLDENLTPEELETVRSSFSAALEATTNQGALGLDWVSPSLSVVAILVSLGAVFYNRQANRMRELSDQARFRATWEHSQPGWSTLVLENTGDAGADRLAAALSNDPSRIRGLEGVVVERVRPGEFAGFILRADQDELMGYITPRAPRILLTWNDQWGTPRHQVIAIADISWPNVGEEPRTMHGAEPNRSGPELFDPRPFGRFARNPWRLRRSKTPRIPWDLPSR